MGTVTAFSIRKQIKNLLIRMELYAFAVKTRDVLRSIRFLPTNVRFWLNNSKHDVAIPPLELIGLVAGTRDIEWFLNGGRLAAESISGILEKNKIPITALGSILDFGCGCGRVLRHFKALSNKTTLYGVDYNPKLIEWCKRNLEFAKFSANQSEPPMNFAAENVDLVYALSVFTHMPEELQLKWLREFVRILKPGGHLIISTHGETYFSDLTAGEAEIFRSGRLVVRDNGIVGSNSYGAYHPFSYVKSIFSDDFVVVDFIPEGAKGNPNQDLYLLMKK